MSVREAILQKLTNSRNLAVERVVELALADGFPAQQKELATVLLARNRRSGWVALIRVFDRLDPEIQDMLLARPRDLFGPLSETMSDSKGHSRENVITIITRSADGKLVHLLAEALSDSRPEVRTLAGASLLEAVRKSRSPENPAWDAASDNFPQMQRAIQFALRQYRTHRQQAAIVAALIFERQQDGAVWAHFQDSCDELTRAAASFIRVPSEPAIIAGTLLALGSPLRSAAMAGLASIEAGPLADALARESHRLLDPLLRDSAKAIARIKVLTTLRNHVLWTEESWPGWLRLIEHLGLQPAQKLALLAHMLQTIPPPPAPALTWKLSLLRALVDLALPDAGRFIASLTADPDERVARAAARYLLAKSKSDWHTLAAHVLPKSPHPALRRLAVGIRAAHTDPSFDKVWTDYQKMPPVIQHATTRAAVTEPAFADQLRNKLASSQPLDIAQGLKMLNAIVDLAPYRGQIITLCGHADARITAVAVRLIGRLEDPKLKDLLEAAAQHADARVRANAVESMSTLHIADRSQQLLAMLNSRHNRERASAIKAMSDFDYPTARDCLDRMLADANPMHRMSALWVVGQLHMLDIIRLVSSIARRDPNVRVRNRAAQMLESLAVTADAGP